MNLIITILVTFIAMALTEFLWAFYIHNLRDGKEHHAGLFCGGIVLCGGLSTILFVGNHYMLIPAATGAYFGTWISGYFYNKK